MGYLKNVIQFNFEARYGELITMYFMVWSTIWQLTAYCFNFNWL